jgi:hypothetical protein
LINVWDYQEAKRLIIITNDNVEHQGPLIDVEAAEDQYDDWGPVEDNITLLIEGRPMGFRQSEIKKVVVLD